MSKAKKIDKRYFVLSELCRTHQPSVQDIAEHTGFPEITVKRQIAVLRNEFKMEVKFVRVAGIGKQGYYELNNWGIIDKAAFMELYDI